MDGGGPAAREARAAHAAQTRICASEEYAARARIGAAQGEVFAFAEHGRSLRGLRGKLGGGWLSSGFLGEERRGEEKRERRRVGRWSKGEEGGAGDEGQWESTMVDSKSGSGTEFCSGELRGRGAVRVALRGMRGVGGGGSEEKERCFSRRVPPNYTVDPRTVLNRRIATAQLAKMKKAEKKARTSASTDASSSNPKPQKTKPRPGPSSSTTTRAPPSKPGREKNPDAQQKAKKAKGANNDAGTARAEPKEPQGKKKGKSKRPRPRRRTTSSKISPRTLPAVSSVLNPEQQKNLALNPKFVPRPRAPKVEEASEAIDGYERRLRLRVDSELQPTLHKHFGGEDLECGQLRYLPTLRALSSKNENLRWLAEAGQSRASPSSLQQLDGQLRGPRQAFKAPRPASPMNGSSARAMKTPSSRTLTRVRVRGRPSIRVVLWPGGLVGKKLFMEEIGQKAKVEAVLGGKSVKYLGGLQPVRVRFVRRRCCGGTLMTTRCALGASDSPPALYGHAASWYRWLLPLLKQG
ncbi:hypothetical protein B0H13DRAFT_1862119 [Mycena leptocephala]|nr:hypothetical protein B0H13DRAFT_1862119 [Mycena leptocephala]